MFRDWTKIYVSYRRNFPHFNRENNAINESYFGYEEEATIGVSIPPSHLFLDDGYNDIEDIELDNLNELSTTNNNVSKILNKETLAPLFDDIARDIDDYLKETSFKMEQLIKLYRQNSLPGFDDKSHDARKFEDLSISVLQLFQKKFFLIL